MTFTLAFYKGRGGSRWQRALDAAVRVRTGTSWLPLVPAKYSHVEFIAGSAQHGFLANCLSASGREGRVRQKAILLDPNRWDLVEINLDSGDPERFIRARLGRRYDYAGILFSQAFRVGWHFDKHWFCSEICAAALGLSDPHKISPQMLFENLLRSHSGSA